MFPVHCKEHINGSLFRCVWVNNTEILEYFHMQGVPKVVVKNQALNFSLKYKYFIILPYCLRKRKRQTFWLGRFREMVVNGWWLLSKLVVVIRSNEHNTGKRQMFLSNRTRITKT